MDENLTYDEKTESVSTDIEILLRKLQELKAIQKNVNGEFSELKVALAKKKYEKTLKKIQSTFRYRYA